MIQIISLISPNFDWMGICGEKMAPQDFFKVYYLHHDGLWSQIVTTREG